MREGLDLSKRDICILIARGQQAKILHQSSADQSSSDRSPDGWTSFFEPFVVTMGSYRQVR